MVSERHNSARVELDLTAVALKKSEAQVDQLLASINDLDGKLEEAICLQNMLQEERATSLQRVVQLNDQLEASKDRVVESQSDTEVAERELDVTRSSLEETRALLENGRSTVEELQTATTELGKEAAKRVLMQREKEDVYWQLASCWASTV